MQKMLVAELIFWMIETEAPNKKREYELGMAPLDTSTEEKIVAISLDDPKASLVNNVDEVKKHSPIFPIRKYSTEIPIHVELNQTTHKTISTESPTNINHFSTSNRMNN